MMEAFVAIDAPVAGPARAVGGHRPWVRLSHGVIAAAVLVLIFSGVAIFLVHPRLYWGATGNDLTPALLALPVGPNAGAGHWSAPVPFADGPAGAVTADRLVEPWNQNSWARSLHFLAAWWFLFGLFAYLGLGLVTGHARHHLWPRAAELGADNVWSDIKAHAGSLASPATAAGPPYGILQKLSYALVAWVALPLMFLTGITMSPAIVADYPVLLDLFGGTQSARTIHFFTFGFVALFLIVHLVMIARTGTRRQLRGMFAVGSR